ncbi:toxin-antitoxin system YwqK family antitoxin [Robiginitalea sp. SC105]|uniref:toxin-antitoxin system YwqK family antitoxin n=1 Tax=Robiginitalea sp. SC105 TaxID=2762332 RepID=UPI00163A40B9|nr:nicotinic acid mononucleotide adenyltransferase [Robiginitalea sp. SC105]MBC2838411.1 nicotinic acid mononucleotide adenyltransferase [Robiginitalea sp. SC105]
MKRLILILLIVPGLMLAQQKRDAKLLEDENLIQAVYYHPNGEISQVGTFNLQGQLHGDWISYSENGEKLSMGSYLNGEKDGKWFFWDKGILREVDYEKNLIASVQEWKEGTRLAVNR